MSRPADCEWEPLGEPSDPVPGDVYQLKALADRFLATAQTIQTTATALRKLGHQESWDSDAGREFASKASETADSVSKAHDRYQEAGEALREYHTSLDTIQSEADKLRVEAEHADGDRHTAQAAMDALPTGTADLRAGQLRGHASEAQNRIDAARGKLETLKKRHKSAGDKAAGRIHTSTEKDGLNDSWLDDLRDTLKAVANIAGIIASVCGILSLLVGWIPVIGQALAGVLGTIALIATVVSLVCHLLLAINGDAEWSDVAMDVLGLATFGIGRVFGAASKLSATLARSKVWSAANAYVRAWNPGANSARVRSLVEDMVGARKGARAWDVAMPNVSLKAAFGGLGKEFGENLSVIKGNWKQLFKVGDNLGAVRNAWQLDTFRGMASMYIGPGMVGELGTLKNIASADRVAMGLPHPFRQALAFNALSLAGTATGAYSDSGSMTESAGKAFNGESVANFLLDRSDGDVTGPDAALAPAGR